MGAWGSGLLDSDAAWDAVDRLARTPVGHRAALVLSGLGVEVPWDVDDASEALVCALLVAMARDPEHFADDRVRVVDHLSRAADIDTFAALVGDRKSLRTPSAARAARAAVDAVRRATELTDLWGDDAAWSSGLDALDAALAAPTAPWPASADRPRTSVAVRKAYRPGTLVGVDLGDGRRGYFVYRVDGWVTAYDVVSPAAGPSLPVARVVSAPVAFSMTFNHLWEAPDEWAVVGLVPAGSELPPLPPRWHKNGPGPSITLWWSDHSTTEVEPRECFALERYGIAWYPSTVTERLRCHHDGQPHVATEEHRYYPRRSRFRVVPRAWLVGGDTGRPAWIAFVALDDALRRQADHAAGVDDVLVEIDEGSLLPTQRTVRVLDPLDPSSRPVTWAGGLWTGAVIAVHDLRASEGGYVPLRQVDPRFP